MKNHIINLTSTQGRTPIKGEFKSTKICGENTCFQVTVTPVVGIGLGIDGSIGYTSNAEKKTLLLFQQV